MAKTKTSSKSDARSSGQTDASPSVATMRAPGTNSSAPSITPSMAKPATAAATRRTAPTHEQIAKRAYEIWVSRGRPVGRDVENWKQAERELGGN